MSFRKYCFRVLGFLGILMVFSWPLTAAPKTPTPIKDMALEVPAGWVLHQKAFNNDVYIYGFANGAEFITIYAKKGTGIVDMKKVFVNGSTIEKDIVDVQLGAFVWKILETSKTRDVNNDPDPEPDNPENDDIDTDDDNTDIDDGDIDIDNKVAQEQVKAFITSFFKEHKGYSYYGFSRSADRVKAMEHVTSFLKAMK